MRNCRDILACRRCRGLSAFFALSGPAARCAASNPVTSGECRDNLWTRHRGAPAIDAHGADIFMLIRSAVPANLPAQIRDDVIGAMALEIVEGKLRPTDIRRRVREYVAVQYRQFSKFGRVSLDARLFEDGNATLLDCLSTEAGTGDPPCEHVPPRWGIASLKIQQIRCAAVEMPRRWSAVYRKDTTGSNSIK